MGLCIIGHTMIRTLYYLFDPLCGWCYGAGNIIPQAVNHTGVTLQLVPTGLFSGEGARLMDAQFAEYAWMNDQRIYRLTGQVFSDVYRTRVLAARDKRFDSGPATEALTAVNLTAPLREYDALQIFQRARYQDGQDITDSQWLASLLAEEGLSAASEMLLSELVELREATQARTARGQMLLQSVGARGVPTCLIEDVDGLRVISSNVLFSGADNVARAILGKG